MKLKMKVNIGCGKVSSVAITETVPEHDILRDEEIRTEDLNILTQEAGFRVWLEY
jgi:hypothetical protein